MNGTKVCSHERHDIVKEMTTKVRLKDGFACQDQNQASESLIAQGAEHGLLGEMAMRRFPNNNIRSTPAMSAEPSIPSTEYYINLLDSLAHLGPSHPLRRVVKHWSGIEA